LLLLLLAAACALTREDAPADGDIASEGALLVNVCACSARTPPARQQDTVSSSDHAGCCRVRSPVRACLTARSTV
jgi:hypothetical protein